MKNEIKISDHFTYARLFRFVLPSVLMMVFISIYGTVDGFFVSNFVGKTAFASVNLIMPFTMIIGGMGFMVGAGGTALVAKVLGEGKRELANRYFTMMVLFTVAMATVCSVLGIVFMPKVAVLLGASDDMVADCVLYGRIVVGFSVFFMLQNLFQSFLVVAERPKLGLLSTVAAGLTNMALDGLFVGILGWKITGAAVATGISQVVGAAVPLWCFFFKRDIPLRFVKTGMQARPILRACANGSSELMSNISMSVVSMLYNLQLMKYLGQDGVSAYGVIMYVQFVFISAFIGYSIGCAPIVGFNFGSQNRSELQNMLRKSLAIMFCAGIVMTATAFLLARPLSDVFVGYDEGLCALTVRAFRIFAPVFLIAGANIFLSGFFTALNNGAVSAAISFLRTLVCQMAAVLLLPLAIGSDGIWWSVVVAEVCAVIISFSFLLGKSKKYGYFH